MGAGWANVGQARPAFRLALRDIVAACRTSQTKNRGHRLAIEQPHDLQRTAYRLFNWKI